MTSHSIFNYLNKISVLAFIIAFTALNINLQAIDSTTYNQKKNDLNSKISGLQNTIGGINKNYEDVDRQADTLEGEIARINKEIATTETIIKDSQAVVVILNQQIEVNNQNITNLKLQIKELLKEIQKNSKVSPLQNIVSSRNFGEALGKLYSLSSIQNKVDELKKNLETQTAELNANKTSQEEIQKDAEDSKILLDAKKDNLKSLVENYRGKEAEYAQQVATIKAQQRELAAQAAKVEKEWKEQLAKEEAQRRAAEEAQRKALSRRVGFTGGYNSARGKCWFEDGGNPGIPQGYFIKPASGVITTNFGCPAITGYSHDGVDIANSRGTSIVASAAGVVDRVGIGGWNGGYGNYIVIKHTLPSGNNVYTLYAHLDGVETSTGAKVSKSQRIGSMGTTGNSTGFHLHFMIMAATYETVGAGCQYGASKCIDPFRFITM